jgi:hypothetical protein
MTASNRAWLMTDWPVVGSRRRAFVRPSPLFDRPPADDLVPRGAGLFTDAFAMTIPRVEQNCISSNIWLHDPDFNGSMAD